MFHVCIAHRMPEKIHKMSKCENSCLFVWSTAQIFLILVHYKVDRGCTRSGNGLCDSSLTL